MAEDRDVQSILEVCRRVSSFWREDPSTAYNGSILYSLTTPAGWRSLVGVNVSGAAQETPAGKLDVWVVPKNLAQIASQDEALIRETLKSTDGCLTPQSKNMWIRLSTPEQAQQLVDQLEAWSRKAESLSASA